MLACKGIFATPSIDAVHVSAQKAIAFRDFIKSRMQEIILPGVKMLACKGIFATPSIDAVHVSAQKAIAFRDFIKSRMHQL